MSYLSKIKQLSIEECLHLCLDFANSHMADAAALIQSTSSSDELEIMCGISIQDQNYQEFSDLPLVHSPILTSVIKRDKPIRLMDASRHPELEEWRKTLELPAVSSLMQIPLETDETADNQHRALLLLKSSGNWQYDQQNTISEELKSYEFEYAEEELSANFDNQNDEINESMHIQNNILEHEKIASPSNFSNIEIVHLEKENQRQKSDINRLLTYIDDINGQNGNGRNGNHEQNEQDQIINNLKTENQKLKESLTEIDQLNVPNLDEPELIVRAKEELRLALIELASLNNRLYQEQSAPMASSENSGVLSSIPADKAERIGDIAQEMRQPLSSILGYTDLLLGETVGILGALQRNFLERVHNSTDRMDQLIADLILLAELDASGIDVSRKPVDVSKLIDEVVSRLSSQLAEKQIIMRLDLPDRLPNIETDKDALFQIIFYLLQNATIATPFSKEITLRAQSDQSHEFGEFLLIELADSGGGITDSDLPRVFSRVYRAQNPVIEGVGDTGVGLTIAETLSIALGGRIWVESEKGKGSTYSVILPLNEKADVPVSA